MPRTARLSDRLVLPPQEPLLAGGAAEAFEREIQQLFRRGQRHLIIDMGGVPAIDSAGIRALVRGHTTSQRLGGSLRLAALEPHVIRVLEESRLASIFGIYESVEAARRAVWPWRTVRIAVAGVVICSALVWIGLKWPMQLSGIDPGTEVLLESGKKTTVPLHTLQPFIELVKLIASPNELVAGEAIRRAGGLKTAAAVAPLAAVMTDGAQPLRLLAVQALNDIASPGALQVLEKSVDDPDRDVRIATLRSIAARAYKPALPRVDSAVKGKRAREVDLTEKMALFEAFGPLAGEPGVPVLEGMLTGKGFLGKREDPELRACAAMALGRIGGAKAMDVLRKASNDNEKEVLVRNAINRALRAPAA